MSRRRNSVLDILVTGPWWIPLFAGGCAVWVFREGLPLVAAEKPMFEPLVHHLAPLQSWIPAFVGGLLLLNLIEKLSRRPKAGKRSCNWTSSQGQPGWHVFILGMFVTAVLIVCARESGILTVEVSGKPSFATLNQALAVVTRGFGAGLPLYIGYKTLFGSWRPKRSNRATDPLLMFVSVGVLCILAIGTVSFSQGDFSLLWRPDFLFLMAAIIGLLLIRTRPVHNWLMGNAGEMVAYLLVRAKLRRPTYRVFGNLLVPGTSGTSQIDMVVLSPRGVDVVEIKCQSGKFYGHSHERTWRKFLNGACVQVPNPLHQNFGHIKALEAFLGLPFEAFRNVVAYAGFAEFPKGAPKGVISIGALPDFLLVDGPARFSPEDLDRIENMLRERKRITTMDDHRAHRNRLKREKTRPVCEPAIGDETPTVLPPPEANLCPWCQSPLRVRTATKGPNPGATFFGCSRYPRCRFTCDPD